ncbi:MAG TPA: APC family permease [Candidatus Acidoferrales bacterium]|nr:APC family permease [Candidatus Acidoferrales bacterium]
MSAHAVSGLGAVKKTNVPSVRKMTVVPMIAATYFMVAGGPYGLEEIVQKTGYRATLLILLITPLIWSLPTALMVSELATSIPEEGGFYIWVRRGMGRFMGFQETWLTLTGSVFEMALYPNLFVAYLGRFAPGMVAGHRGLAIGFGMIAICALWNIAGVGAVGEGSVTLNVALLLPFIALVGIGFFHWHGNSGDPVPVHHADLLGGILIAMWNYMGWDNLSTIAGEVERPQKTYTRAMFGAVLLVVVSYLLPVGAVAHTGVDPNLWTDGGWVDIGRILGGEALAIAIAIAGVIGALGSFGALMMSFTRLPGVMAQDGYLPKIFTRTNQRTGAPWVAILACALFWAACYPLGFERSLILDVLLTGLSILLEFWALVALRIREPNLARPYRVPGGTIATILIGLPPLALIIATLVRNSREAVGTTNELVIGAAVIAAGVLLYFLSGLIHKQQRQSEGASLPSR